MTASRWSIVARRIRYRVKIGTRAARVALTARQCRSHVADETEILHRHAHDVVVHLRQSRGGLHIVMKLTHRLQTPDTHPMQAMVPDEPQRSRAERVSVPAPAIDEPRWLRWRKTMRRTNDMSTLGHAALDHCRPVDTELDTVTGGVGEVFLTAILPTVHGHTDATWTPRTYAVDPDLSGGVTGARAGLYERRRT
jgi:hypothetical protein